ncbi:MAG: ComEA family DNA-binding protein [Candidatus Blackburnbacteria bacterium]|nr:ComEA family DNA-binding protein [Candidatus Blackburnbacteria bacterium]
MAENLTFQEKIEELVFKNRRPISLVLLGFLLLGFGVFFLRAGFFETTKVEVIKQGGPAELANHRAELGGELVVEIQGAVEKPGVYRLNSSSRVEDLLIKASGLSAAADRDWVNKNLNRAAKLADGQKIYIPSVNPPTPQTSLDRTSPYLPNLINLNSATLSELDSLPGVGAVRAQAIIDGRPYSSVEDLLSKKILPKNVYEKIRERVVAP